jgi:mono/diheme cytochrome c family protein
MAAAQVPALHQYPDADLPAGEKLLRDHNCAACHVRKVGGDGNRIYRPAGRINTPAALLTMVERCNTELSLQLFPEDVVSIAAVLQRDHYRFAAGGTAQKP